MHIDNGFSRGDANQGVNEGTLTEMDAHLSVVRSIKGT
jgi:hypothetical protein